jgi:hypothetical protein
MGRPVGMNRLLLLPITLPIRLAVLPMRLALDTAEWALQVAQDLTEPLARRGPAEVGDDAPPVPPGASAALPATSAPEPAAAEPSGAAAEQPAAEAEPPRPRPRRTARQATAGRAARHRASGPTKGEVAAIREANREAEGAEGGPGPELHVEEPWEGYADMRLDEVLARLENATEAELAVVRMYESQHENRQAILLATENG